jgi:hypothetical protein
MSSTMSGGTDQEWRRRTIAMGLDPDNCNGEPVYKLFDSIDQADEVAQHFMGIPGSAKVAESNLTPEKVAELSYSQLRSAIVAHLTRTRRISDAKVKAAIEKRLPKIGVQLRAAPDITITKDKPLIIDEPSGLLNYNKMTIKNGGYIEISADCAIVAVTFVREPGGGNPKPADIFIHGEDGVDRQPGTGGSAGTDGRNGDRFRCDSAGGCCKSDGQRGGDGTDGGDAKPGERGGDAAAFGPQVTLALGTVSGLASLFNRGGNGGRGAAGGKGGDGGKGGKGGDGGMCVGCHCGSGSGGNGGDAGDGATNADGGNGGNGSNVIVTYVSDGQPGSEVRAQPSVAGRGGPKGAIGAAGTEGKGGDPGSSGGGQPGNNGAKGNNGPDTARDGQPGQSPGTVIINGKPAGVA